MEDDSVGYASYQNAIDNINAIAGPKRAVDDQTLMLAANAQATLAVAEELRLLREVLERKFWGA